jgi:hypothetical protein
VSRDYRVSQRVVEDRVPVHKCDGCGSVVDAVEDDYRYHAAPRTWFLLLTPAGREAALEGADHALSMCSSACVKRFAEGYDG